MSRNLPILLTKSLISLFVVLLTSNSLLAADRGEAVFKLCAACHGYQGEGNEVLKAPSIAGLPAWYIEAQINKFRSGARGSHPADIPGLRMRPMARTLYSKTDISSVSNFVANLKPMASQPTITGSVIAGEAKFKICASCHGTEAKGMQAVSAPPLVFSSDWYLLTQLKNFKNGLRGNDPAKDPTGATMSGMAAILDEKAMHDVIVYIQTLK